MTESQKSVQRLLKSLPVLRVRIKTLEIRLQTEFPSTTANYSPIGRVSGVGPGDSTAGYVVKREELEQELKSLRDQVRMIEQSLELLRDDEMQIIDLVYFQGMGVQRVIMETYMSHATFWRRHTGALQKLAEILTQINRE